jgi:hypothetical protein
MNSGDLLMKRIPKPETFWSFRKTPPTAERNLDLILPSAVSLPLTYWRERFLFNHALDEELFHQTSGLFPARIVPGKSHPVFTLKRLDDGMGFKVCPCTSKIPRGHVQYRFIRNGCVLKYSEIKTDRDSYILHWLFFNIPRSMALKVRFQGEVPKSCLSGEREQPTE